MDLALLKQDFLGNPASAWATAAALFVGSLILFRVLRSALRTTVASLVTRSESKVDDVVVDTLKRTKWFFYVCVSIYIASRGLTLPESTERVLRALAAITLLVQVGLWSTTALRSVVSLWATERGEASSSTFASAVNFIGWLTIWSLIVLLGLANLGIEISALLAGLGVGGIAAALAIKNLLSDVFASLSIYFDRPFDIGDFIVVGETKGSVERVGLRSTRLRSPNGEEIVFANADLVQNRIQNFGRMRERRVEFRITLEYNLPYERLAAVPDMLRAAVESVDQTRFERAHFKTYADQGLVFEIAYVVTSPDNKLYLDRQQAINFDIYRRFDEAGIVFAGGSSKTLTLRAEPSDAEATRALRGLTAQRR